MRATDAVTAAGERLSGSAAACREVVRRTRRARVTFLAAAVAYFFAVSLVPLAVMLVVVASLVGGTDIALVVIRHATRLLGPEADGLLYDVLTDQASGAKVTAVGLPVLLWGALRTFRSLDTAFEEVYRDESRDSLAESLVDAAVVLGATSLGAALMIGVGFFLDPVSTVGNVLEPVALFVALAVVFYPMFYLFPDADPEPRTVLPGTLFTAACWTGFQMLFQTVAIPIGRATVAGTFGVVLLTLTWLYVGSLLMLVGASINAVVGERAAVAVAERRLRGYA